MANKMQPPLNASQAWHTLPADSLKKREPSKNIQKQIKSGNRRWQAKN